jgi:hypothetical protein
MLLQDQMTLQQVEVHQELPKCVEVVEDVKAKLEV